MTDQYILDGKTPVREPDMHKWCRWFETKGTRQIARDRFFMDDGSEEIISTVFLGVDHRYDDSGPPVLFETMVFGGPLDQEQERYCTYDEALAGHADMVARVRAAR